MKNEESNERFLLFLSYQEFSGHAALL